MTTAERELLLHRWAIRVNLPADAARAAEASRQLVASARDAGLDAGLPVPADVERAADTLDWCARFIADLLDHELAEQDRLGLDPAAYQRRVEQHPARPPEPPQPGQ
jgi:hypothetical protein